MPERLAQGSHLTDVQGKRGAETDGQVLARLGALQLRRLRANRGPIPADQRGMTAAV